MKNVIITGSANGVGKAIANVLKEEKLILIDIDENNLKQVAEETKSKYYICDISDDKQIANVINDINRNYEKNETKLDIGVHKNFDIEQDEYCFDLNNIKESVTLLINSKEQIFTEN